MRFPGNRRAAVVTVALTLVLGEGVRLNHPQDARGGEVLSTETVSTELDLGPVLQGRAKGADEVVASIRRVDLGRPRLQLLRDRRGTWSLESLFKTPPGRP